MFSRMKLWTFMGLKKKEVNSGQVTRVFPFHSLIRSWFENAKLLFWIWWECSGSSGVSDVMSSVKVELSSFCRSALRLRCFHGETVYFWKSVQLKCTQLNPEGRVEHSCTPFWPLAGVLMLIYHVTNRR